MEEKEKRGGGNKENGSRSYWSKTGSRSSWNSKGSNNKRVNS